MTLSNIHSNMIVPKYKIMCELLEEIPKTGKSKKLQLKDWARYFKFEQDGHKFFIIEVYEQEIEKVDLRVGGNNSKYVEHIEYILLTKLSKCEGYAAVLTKKNLFEYLGMINSLYLQKSKVKIELPEQDDRIKLFDINHFYQRTSERLTRILFDALRSLKNRFLITYREINIVVRLDKNGNEVCTEADPIELSNIIDAKYRALEEMELKKIQQVALKFKMDKFYHIVNRILKVEYDIERTFVQYEIIFNKENIIKELNQMEMNKHRTELNNKVIDTINDNARKNFADNFKEYDTKLQEILLSDMMFGDNYAKNVKFFRYHEDYVDIQMELADCLLKLE